MQRDIEFNADGVTLRGWLFTPDEGSGPYPAVVAAHGFSAVKEQTLGDLGVVLADAGLAAVIYDHRCLGASDGSPRQDIDPVTQARDMRHAITFAETLDEVNADRIGIFGTSYSGAEVLQVAALDRRVKAVVSQVPMISGWRNLLRLIPYQALPDLLAQIDAERRTRFHGAEPATIRVATDDPSIPHAFPGLRTFEYFTKLAPAERWVNEVTVRSLDWLMEYDVTPYMERISPTPLLMIVSQSDMSTPTDEALAAYDRALEPKKLLLLRGDHYTSYVEDFGMTSTAARDWFLEHLTG